MLFPQPASKTANSRTVDTRNTLRLYLAISLFFCCAARPAILPAGTELQVRLTTEVSAKKPSGEHIAAVLIAPVYAGGAPAIAAGARLTGNTTDVRAFEAATDDEAEAPATLRIQFTMLEDAAGHSKPIHCVVRSVDNAREPVDSSGLITGIKASQTFDAEIEKGIGKLEARYGQFAEFLSGIKSAVLKQVDPSIDYPAGVELAVALTQPLEWNAPAPHSGPRPIEPASALAALVSAEPFRTRAQNPPTLSDITNLMFLGTAEQIESAFREAGWFAAEAFNGVSKFETARAIIEDQGYSEAPMSLLYLDGRAPDLTFQKQNNTFAKRHHIRIWRRPERFQGQPVWVAAATHDISISFSAVSRSFTHSIDPNIDLDRAKVTDDLVFTGAIQALALAPRDGIPRDATNATGDRLVTDGKIAVLEF